MHKIDPVILEKALYWSTDLVFDKNTREEIKGLLKAKNKKELVNRFYRELEFGTGGMRGLMGAGSCRINIYNIRKATYALALYLKSLNFTQPLSVAISYDSRNNSQLFAQSAAEVLAACDITVRLTKQMRPVPLLSYMVRHFQCHAGICITASHNPSAYNGFKVYWQGGGQLVPPHDKAIISFYNSIKTYEDIPFIAYEQGKSRQRIYEIANDLDAAYLEQVKSLSLNGAGRKNFKIVYSPLHGTGIFLVPQALKIFGFQNIIIVPEQEIPNGDFPTVSSPNPEDPASLQQAQTLAQQEKADLVLATDPDADRVGILVPEQGQWLRLNGNQIGSLLYEYILCSLKQKGHLPSLPLVIKTVVTTDLQREIAEYYGVECEETLTGFKWICSLMDAYESGIKKPHKNFVCGGEESYGFLTGTFVRDKDAVIACVMVSEMVAFYKEQGKSLSQVLDEIFLRHKVYHETLFTLELGGQDGSLRIKRIMDHLRSYPPQEISSLEVLEISDFVLGKTKNLKDGKEKLLSLPKENLLQFFLSQAKVSIRPSGTEPKIKIYVSAFASVPELSALVSVKNSVRSVAQSIEMVFTDLIMNIE